MRTFHSPSRTSRPSIGEYFDASQTQLNLVAVGYSLGLAASVLWLGALGDRYGRKQMLLFGVALSLPICLASAWAPSIYVLIVARIVGGIAAGDGLPDHPVTHHRPLGR
ncbi:MAG: MFS transporter [Microthrixaceae bacterium]|nr:MFS transporter [Microthrixaceae bacterium]